MTLKDFAVLQVVSGAPDPVIGVNLGGDQGYVNLQCPNAPYQPQEGDVVRIDMDSMPGQPFFHSCRTPGRTWQPPIVGLTVSTAAPPSGSGYVATSTLWAKDGALWAAVPPTAPSTSGRKTFAPIDSHTWDATNGWAGANARNNLCHQGAFPGVGPSKGLFFYGAAAFAALAGRTLTGISIKLQRADGIGTPYAPKPIYVVGHSYTGQPAGEPAVVGSWAVGKLGTEDPLLTFPLPLSVAAGLQSGALAGVGIASSSGDDYLAVLGAGSGSGALSITWSS